MFTKVLVCCFFAMAATQVVQESHQPKSFGSHNTDELRNPTTREEAGDLFNNVGSYGYVDARGAVRTINYVSNADGFRVNVETSEPRGKIFAPTHAQFLFSDAEERHPVTSKAAQAVPVTFDVDHVASVPQHGTPVSHIYDHVKIA